MQQEYSWLLISGIAFSVFAYCSHWFGRFALSVILLVLSALFFRLFIIHQDQFLHDWDEKFHALVARNMMDEPFKPMLYAELFLPYDYQSWTANHVWLHKQPLFMWQMALSMKIFGVSEWAARFPSALMGAIMVFFLYRIAWLFSKDRLIAFGAGLLMCCSNYQLELSSGFIGMDHNDVAFGFYVLASVWAYAESLSDRRLIFVILVGVFAGCAILNKWLTGLIVFAGWGLNFLLAIRKPGATKEFLRILLAAGVCLLVFLPWQIYILNVFQPEASHEFAYNSKHVFTAVENHEGDWLFFYRKLPQYFGHFTWYFLPAGMFIFFFIKTPDRPLKLALITTFMLIFLFFSILVKTKMQSYLFVVAPIGYLFMACCVRLFQFMRLPKRLPQIIGGAGLAVCAFYLFNYEGIRNYFHDPANPKRIAEKKNADIYKNLGKYIKPGTKYVLNLGETAEIDLMFYNKGIVAYHGNLNNESIKMLAGSQYPVGIFKNHARYTDADRVTLSQQFYIIDAELQEVE